jgi:chromatin remodeling complex protein RSC6
MDIINDTVFNINPIILKDNIEEKNDMKDNSEEKNDMKDNSEEKNDMKDNNEGKICKKLRKKRVHRIINYENIDNDLNMVIKLIEEKIDNLKQKKLTGIKFMKSLNKTLMRLQEDVKKVSKKNIRLNNRLSKSGFTKLVPVSIELSTFCHWIPGENHSRNESTKFICKYIKDHQLQCANDGRIINPDKSLAKLLKYDKVQVGVLKYPTIQKLIQIHFR